VAGAEFLDTDEQTAKEGTEKQGGKEHGPGQPQRADEDIGDRRRLDGWLYYLGHDGLRCLDQHVSLDPISQSPVPSLQLPVTSCQSPVRGRQQARSPAPQFPQLPSWITSTQRW